LDLVATSSNNKATLRVEVIFQAPPTFNDTKNNTHVIFKDVNATTTTTKGNSTESIVISVEETKNLLEFAICIKDEEGDISCVGTKGFSFKIEAETGTTVRGHSSKKASFNPRKLPKLSVKKLNTLGLFSY
jgi:hypothetical protein